MPGAFRLGLVRSVALMSWRPQRSARRWAMLRQRFISAVLWACSFVRGLPRAIACAVSMAGFGETMLTNFRTHRCGRMRESIPDCIWIGKCMCVHGMRLHVLVHLHKGANMCKRASQRMGLTVVAVGHGAAKRTRPVFCKLSICNRVRACSRIGLRIFEHSVF